MRWIRTETQPTASYERPNDCNLTHMRNARLLDVSTTGTSRDYHLARNGSLLISGSKHSSSTSLRTQHSQQQRLPNAFTTFEDGLQRAHELGSCQLEHGEPEKSPARNRLHDHGASQLCNSFPSRITAESFADRPRNRRLHV